MAVQTTLDQLPSPHSSSDYRSLSPLSPNQPDQSLTPRSSVSSSRPIGDSNHPSPPLPSSALPRHHFSGPTHKPQRSSSALLNFAAAALDKTQSAFANTLEPVVRPRQSNSALARLSLGTGSFSSSESVSPVKVSSLAGGASTAAFKGKSHTTPPGSTLPVADPHTLDPPSQRYSETDPNTLPPLKLPSTDSKMHQTSSRLLRMTDDDRPFTKVSLSCCI
jgi:hypothetical protein